MQRRAIYLVLVCAVFILTQGVCFSQAVTGIDKPVSVTTIGEPVIDTSLRGIKEIVPYVTMYWTGEKPSDDLAEKIEESAAQKLKEAGINVSSSEPNEAMKEAMLKVLERRIKRTQVQEFRMSGIPELIIRIYGIKHEPTNSYVFGVQTSLARKVYTAQLPRRVMKAEVWRIDVSPSATDANSFESVLTDTVLGQVDTFITAEQKANQERKITAGEAPRQNKTTADSEKQNGKEPTSEAVKDSYLASKNSKVFHRADCSSARRISPKNIVRYDSRAEAIRDGKRPCKICKP